MYVLRRIEPAIQFSVHASRQTDERKILSSARRVAACVEKTTLRVETMNGEE